MTLQSTAHDRKDLAAVNLSALSMLLYIANDWSGQCLYWSAQKKFVQRQEASKCNTSPLNYKRVQFHIFSPTALIVDNIFLFHFQQLKLSIDKIWESARPKRFQTNMSTEHTTNQSLCVFFSGTKKILKCKILFFHSIIGVGMNRDGIGWALGRLNKVDQMVDRTYMVLCR